MENQNNHKENTKSISLLSLAKTQLSPFRWYVWGLILVAFIWAIDLSLRPYLIKLMLDHLASVPANQAIEAVWKLALSFTALSFLFLLAFRFYDWLVLKVFPYVRQNLIREMMSRMMHHSYSFFQNNFAGSLTNKVNDVARGFESVVQMAIDRFLSHTLALLIAVFTLSTVHPLLGLITVIWIITVLGVAWKASRKTRSLSQEYAEANSHVTGKAGDIITNMSVVRAFATHGYEQKTLNKEIDKSVDKAQNLFWFLLKFNWFMFGFFILTEAISLWSLLYFRKAGLVTVGDFALVFTVQFSLINCLGKLSTDFGKFAESLGLLRQGLQITMIPAEIKDDPKASALQVKNGKISFKKVSFYHHSSIPLFQDLTVTIPSGQRVGLVGASGVGKSTFVNLIMRLFDVKEGQITIDNQNICEVTQDSLRRAISFIPQDPVLFHRSLKDNILYGKLEAREDEIILAAQKAHAHDFIIELPKGYDTLVGERGVKLSGGQRQRIAIARAILKNAPILIMDEATSALDSLTEKYIQESLHELMQGKTTIVIAHRLSTLLQMDRLLVFDQGRIVEEGTHEELLSANTLYKRLWQAQVGGFLP